MDICQAIHALVDKDSLSAEQMTDVMRCIMTGQASDIHKAAFLIALRMKGETVTEITAAASLMRELAIPVHVSGEHLVDIVGTGGDGSGLFNVSTVAAFVAAAAGAMVAKHGNRSVSSSSGSADLLEAAGASLTIDTESIARCVQEVGIGFMFAPQHHQAMQHVSEVRRALGLRTVFNLLGPLTNPARVPNQLVGVFSQQWLRPMAQVLQQLGSEHVLVVHADDGLDEISIASVTHVAELNDGVIKEYAITPEQFSIRRGELSPLKVSNAEQSLAITKAVLSGKHSAASDMVIMNAGAAIYVAGRADTLAEGIKMAEDTLASGTAGEKFKEFIQVTQCIEQVQHSNRGAIQ